MIDVHLDGLLDSGVHDHVTFHGFHCDALVQFRLETDIEQTAIFYSGRFPTSSQKER